MLSDEKGIGYERADVELLSAPTRVGHYERHGLADSGPA